jgi:hypothetical protein
MKKVRGMKVEKADEVRGEEVLDGRVHPVRRTQAGT